MNDISVQEFEEYLKDVYKNIHHEINFKEYEELRILKSFYQEFLNMKGSKRNE